jgi:hypothetical protein
LAEPHRGDEAQAGKEISGDFVAAEAPQFNQLEAASCEACEDVIE